VNDATLRISSAATPARNSRPIRTESLARFQTIAVAEKFGMSHPLVYGLNGFPSEPGS